MCATEGLHANKASRQIYEELSHLVASDLLLDDGLAKLINPVQLKHIFNQIDTYCSNYSSKWAFVQPPQCGHRGLSRSRPKLGRGTAQRLHGYAGSSVMNLLPSKHWQ